MESIISGVRDLEQTKNTLLSILFQYHYCNKNGGKLPGDIAGSLEKLFLGQRKLVSFTLESEDTLYYLDYETLTNATNDGKSNDKHSLLVYTLNTGLAQLQVVGEINDGGIVFDDGRKTPLLLI